MVPEVLVSLSLRVSALLYDLVPHRLGLSGLSISFFLFSLSLPCGLALHHDLSPFVLEHPP
jgi:hypothetical protein